MLEHETDLLLGAIAQTTIGDEESFLLADLLAADVPEGIKVYMQAEVRRWLEQDLGAAPKFSHLDRNLPEVEKKIRLLLHSLAPSYRFRRAEYLTILDHAVHFVGSYLCRPRWTLEHLVFDNAMRVSTQQVLARLDYIADYRYFAVLLEKVIHRHNWSELDLDDFRQLVCRIDNEVVRQHSARELASLARPIFTFLKPITEDGRSAIPIEAVQAFLDDKEKRALHDYLEAVWRIRGKDKITLDEFAQVAEDLHSGNAQPPLMKTEAGAAATTPSAPATPLEPAPPIASAPPVEIVETPIPATPPVTAEAMPGAPLHPLESSPKPDPNADILHSKNIALSLTFAGLHDTQPPAQTSTQTPPAFALKPGLPDLRVSFSQQDRRRLATVVFQKDEEYVESVIEVLNSMHTWKEASLYLNKLYQLHQLDPFQSDVIMFTDIVQRRFMRGAR